MRRSWSPDPDFGLPEDIERVGASVLDVAFRVHSAFGPGALESLYRRALARGLEREGRSVETEVWIPVAFEGELFDRALRCDLVVDGCVVVELKAVEEIHPAHVRQVLSYIHLGGYPLGLLLNFGAARLRHGFKRFPNRKALEGPSRPSRPS